MLEKESLVHASALNSSNISTKRNFDSNNNISISSSMYTETVKSDYGFTAD